MITVWIQNDVGHYIQQAIRNLYDPTQTQVLHTTLGMIPPNAIVQQWEHDLRYMAETPGILYWTKVPCWKQNPPGMMPYLTAMVQLAKKNGSQIILDVTDIPHSHQSNTISTRDCRISGNRSSHKQVYSRTSSPLVLLESCTRDPHDSGYYTTILSYIP